MQAITEAELKNWRDYTVESPRDISALLRQMYDKNQLIRLLVKGTAESCMTSLLQVDPDSNTVILDRSPSREQNERILSSPKVMCETSLDKIRIVFNLEGLRETTFDGTRALRADIPPSLVRLQRREFYRMPTPVIHPVYASIPLAEAQGGALFALADISCGGIAVLDKGQLLGTTIGETFADCQIDLPEIGKVTTSLQLRHALDAPLPNNKINRRVGLQFVDVSGAGLSVVQRYITKLERERNARQAGLA